MDRPVIHRKQTKGQLGRCVPVLRSNNKGAILTALSAGCRPEPRAAKWAFVPRPADRGARQRVLAPTLLSWKCF
jgi:hypothetical protein